MRGWSGTRQRSHSKTPNRRPRARGSFAIELRLIRRPELGRRLDRNDLKVHQIIPSADPRVQRFPIRRFHDLKAPGVRCVNPTCMVDHDFRHHPTAASEAVANRFGIVVLEGFDDHEEHDAHSIFRVPGLLATPARTIVIAPTRIHRSTLVHFSKASPCKHASSNTVPNRARACQARMMIFAMLGLLSREGSKAA